MTILQEGDVDGVDGMCSVNGNATKDTTDEMIMPIAIVGMSCRFPGDSNSPEHLWEMLAQGKSGWASGAGGRFQTNSFYHPAAELGGVFKTRGFHLLTQDLAEFDAHFFNISPLEAKSIDPQQRLLLEVAYEAFENAGLSLEKISGSDTGVWIAGFNSDYERMLSRDPENAPTYRVTGTGIAIMSNRISYVFDLKGPSVTLDTGCSGSLVALHHACQSIRNGEIDQALVGGTNLILDPELTNSLSSLRMLGESGRCFTFDDRAEGYGRGEGVGAVIIKPLSKALEDGDAIRAVIRNTAVNQDGRTQGITMPNGSAQEALMHKAYTEAGLDPKTTSYVEAHGTGTEVGDAVEAGAIAAVFSKGRQSDCSVMVGSIKTNVGHTEGTAGMAGLIKTILMLEKGKILPNHDFKKLSHRMPDIVSHIQVPKSLLQWPIQGLRRASVNSFGYGGTNAHAILDAVDNYQHTRGPKQKHHGLQSSISNEASGVVVGNDHLSNHRTEHFKVDDSLTRSQKSRLFIISSNSRESLRMMVDDLKAYVTRRVEADEGFLDDLAYTMCCRRSLLPFRMARSAPSITGFLDSLAHPSVEEELAKPHRALDHAKLCFVFTGQGAQWPGMGRELFGLYPVFERSIEAAEALFNRLGARWSLRTELFKDEKASNISKASLSQPLSTAIQLALVDLFRAWNIRPSVVVGHSSGEIAAAYSAGALSFDDALAVAYHRGRLVEELCQGSASAQGGMIAVGLSVDEAIAHIDSLPSEKGKLCVACINSPLSVTVSGDRPAVLALREQLEAHAVFNRLLVVDVAYHSHQMGIIYDAYIEAVSAVIPKGFEDSTRMVSTVLGGYVEGEDLDATYWARNLVSPVRFAEAFGEVCTEQLASEKISESIGGTIIEIGPHSALAGPIRQIQRATGSDMRYDSALVRKVDASQTVLHMAGSLCTQGVSVNLSAVNMSSKEKRSRVLSDYPPYAWSRSIHWHEGRISSQYRGRQVPRDSLLGVPSPDNNPLEPKWRNYLRVAEMPWVSGHAVQGRIVYPASGYICMAIEAVRQQARLRGESEKNVLYVLRDINITRALLVPNDQQGIEVVLSLRPYPQTARSSSATWSEFRIFSVSGSGDWGEHCRGLISVQTHVSTDEVEGNRENEALATIAHEKFAAARRGCDTDLEPSKLYDHLTSVSFQYTGPFQGLTRISTKPFESLCTFEIPDVLQTMPGGFDQSHCVHPVTLDLCFQALMPALLAAGMLDAPPVLTFIEELTVSGDIMATPGTEFLTDLRATNFATSKIKADINVQETSEDTPVLSIIGKGLVYTSLFKGSTGAGEISEQHPKPCHRLEWVPDITCAEAQGVRELCSSVLSDDSALDALDRIGKRARYINKVTLASIRPDDEKRMLPHHKLLLRWMQKNTSKEGQEGIPEPVGHLGGDGEAVERIGVHILDILKGEVDPLAILMEGDLLYKVYTTKAISRCVDQVAEYVRMLSQKHPAMKVLEIGAGTGSATIPILKAFSSQGGHSSRPLLDRYTYTDVSTAFFEKAKDTLEPWLDCLDFQKLDIEKSINEQGLNEGSFDLIIACLVLHATSDMSTTMTNVRKLLKPDGKLCLIEVTQPSMMAGLVFGTLPGWWLAAGGDGRTDSPLLSMEQWNVFLNTNGFSGVDLWLPDYHLDKGQQYSAMVSTAVGKIRQSLLPQIDIVHFNNYALSRSNQGSGERSFAQETAKCFKSMATHTDVHEAAIDEVQPEGKVCIVMLEMVQPFLSSCDEAGFEQVKRMFSVAKGVVWITTGGAVECKYPLNAVVTGLARCSRSENRTTKVMTVDIDLAEQSPELVASILLRLVDDAFTGPTDAANLEFEYAVRNGRIWVPRLVEDENLNRYMDADQGSQVPRVEKFFQAGRSLALQVGTPGLLETMVWTDEPSDQALAYDEIRVELRYSAINFRDLMVALGQLEDFPKMAGECSGVVVDVGSTARFSFRVGDRVCAVGGNAYASSGVIKMYHAYRIPDTISLEVAASIPVAYTTAYYCLKTVADLQKHESVLIHSAAGALGQAAVMFAQHLGAVIYVTVGSSRKKSFMMSSFGIPEHHIFSSRLTNYSRGIKRLTGGKGVDVVLNSLAADTVRESCACIAKFGRFIEVGKQDASVNARLSMEMFSRHVMFAAVDLSLIWTEKPLLFQSLLSNVVKLVENGAIGHIKPIEVKSLDDIEAAFRLMQTGKHMGKILLKADATTQVRPPPHSAARFREDGWYVIAGGTGGLGQAIIGWMAGLGAKNIIAISRSGGKGEKFIKFSKQMKEAGVNLLAESLDITDIVQVNKILDLTGGQPVSGVIQGAVMLIDATLDIMSFKQWQDTLAPKVQGTQNLYGALGGSLDFFIMLSSGSGLIGSYGQGSYAAANTFLDAFARSLSSQGHPVRSLDLGGIAGAGYVAEHPDSTGFLERQGLNTVELDRMLALLNNAVAEPFSQRPSDSQWSLGLGLDRSEGSHRRSDGKFSHLYARHSKSNKTGPRTKKDRVDILKALRESQSTQQAIQIVCESIIGKVSDLLATPLADISPSKSVSAYGADSLVAVELQNWLAVYLKTEVQTLELLGAASIRQLSATVISRCNLVPSSLVANGE